MLTVEVDNRSGETVDVAGAVALARLVLEREGVDEMRSLKREHLGIDETTDVLSFPLDGRDELPSGEPRALGDVVLCPPVVGDDWRWPLVHGLLHLLGYEHGPAMEAREVAHLA
jgi:probable rRNA maturation factor